MMLLDAYSCSGGAGWGYKLAGFKVVGVDIEAQPRYSGDLFLMGDAIDAIMVYGRKFDFIHASPPCQFDSECQRIQGNDHPDLIGPTREALEAVGKPYVIENVEGARYQMKDPVTLCGAMFGIRTYRHRLFEAGGGFSFQAPAHPMHVARQAKMGRIVGDGEFMHVVGHFSGTAMAREIMGMPWATRDELAEAVPPVYTEYVGLKALEYLKGMR